MSAIFEAARVYIYTGDYIAADPTGKLNAIGLSANLLSIQPNLSPPVSAPLSIAVIIEIPRRFAGEQFNWAVELRDLTTDSAVLVPSAPDGRLEALRIQQLSKAEFPNIPGLVLPEEMPCRVTLAMQLGTGLPLTPNHAYEWRVSVDGSRRKSWGSVFCVLGPPPPPIVGGPAGPASIPNLPTSEEDEPAEDA